VTEFRTPNSALRIHFAVLCPEASGHFNPMTTLLAELGHRGHDVTWIGTVDGVELARERGLRGVAIGADVFPAGTLPEQLAEIGELSGLKAVRRTIEGYRQGMRIILDEAPQAIRDSGATALIADESIFAARTVAQLVQLPWVTVCNALPFHPDLDHPPVFPAWQYRRGWSARLRNRIGRLPAQVLLRPIRREIVTTRRRHGLGSYDLAWENPSERATLAQLPAEFDYPRRDKPAWFHYVGGLHDIKARPPVEFPFDRLDDRPLIYASLGTVQNRLLPLFRTIAESCCGLPAQLVISLGRGSKPNDMGPLPGNPLLVEFAPQLELIRRAKLVITHAGMNTTAEAIAQGVPMVAIPITNDQPSVAARIAWSGCGRVIPLRKVTVKRLAAAVREVLGADRYTLRAHDLAEANRQAGGVPRAADIIERAVTC
jgi:zeaxanthin glucosyltransferase